MDFGQRGRRGGRGRGFGGGFRRDGGFDDNRNRSDSSNWRSQNSDGVSSSENDTTKMYVEENCVGRIIGRGGSKIRELQDSSGANIKVNRNETEGGKVLVVVKGSADARTQAEDMIKELTESFNGLSAGNNRGGGGRSGWGRSSEDTWGSSAGQTGNGEETLGSSSETTDIYVDPSCVGRIIGKGGSKIRELQDESGANIKVNRNETEGGKVLVVVTGSADARTQAEDMIKELTESFNDSSGYRGGGGVGGRSSDWDFNDGNADSVGNGEKTRMFNNKGSSSETTEIHVDQSCVGRIIGRGGSKIQDLQDESGAKIKVTRNETEDGKIIVVLTGSADARTQAEDMIKELTESCFDSSSSYRGGGGGRSTGWGSTDDNAGNGEETEKPKINWGIIRAAKEANEAKKFEGLPPLEKNFYFEDPDVANMHPGEVKEIRKKNNNIIVEGGEKRVPNPVRTFEEAFQHYPEILQQIYNQKFVEPSPIQKQAWPILLQGLDLIGIAQTGTGKTLAFLLPALIHIDNQPVPREKRGGPNVLVLSPTRELAQQIEVEVKKINYRGIRSVVVYGGGNRRSQINVVTRGVEIIVATPGRLNDLIMNGIVDVKSVTYLVLDEADRMLDMGFEPEIRKILLDIRRDRQTVMTSATWPQDVQRLADMYMSSPINIFVGTLDLAACHSVTQLVEMLDDEEKKPRLFEFLQYELQPIDKVIVFVGKKVLADDLSSDLAMEGVECQCIHGDREQCDREAALSDFKSGAVRILIATDVASRGLDVKDITHVLNYDFPRNIEEYVHRIGRTGRAGNTGTSITFITRGDWRQAQKLIDIMAEADQEIPDILIKMAERYQAHRERVAQEGGGFGGRGGRGGRGRGGGFGGGRRGGGGFGGGGGGGEDDGFISGGFGRGAFRGGGGRGRRDKEYDIHMGW
ncbi:probable ATP-dependent RNA helicase DDX43 isoform X4 [Haliotis rufescens]|uniref:probable ATP-dependent RNA helicase DDX43 isoform X4 n=1 Tax=Haliotis rufescens TaxID=6454 RepID=UPI00201F792A|nr:probable ATP-dependent RNA helicase DDX43 isoform X4 [Haliotis rufescens]